MPKNSANLFTPQLLARAWASMDASHEILIRFYQQFSEMQKRQDEWRVAIQPHWLRTEQDE